MLESQEGLKLDIIFRLYRWERGKLESQEGLKRSTFCRGGPHTGRIPPLESQEGLKP